MKPILSILFILFLGVLPKAQTPGFQWAIAQAGNGYGNESNSVKVDGFGNVYSCGTFSITNDFDPGPGVLNLVSSGERDIYITKVSPSGVLVWAKSVGASGNDVPSCLTIDNNGDLIVTGTFTSTVDFDPGPGTSTISSSGSSSGFIAKYNNSGDLIFVRGYANMNPYQVTTDASNNILSTGFIDTSCDFDPGPGSYILSASNGFVHQLNPSGNFVLAKVIPSFNEKLNISLDATGNIFLSGNFVNTDDFDPGPGVYNLTANLFYTDIFIEKLNSSGDFVWAKSIGGPQMDLSNSITIDANGELLITGSFSLTVDFDPSPAVYNLTTTGFTDAFVAKFSTLGELISAFKIGGTGPDKGSTIKTNFSNDIFLLGTFSGTVDFDPSPATKTLDINNGDRFLAKYNANGSFLWVTNYGIYTYCQDFTLDNLSNIYSCGYFEGTNDFDPGAGSFTLVAIGSQLLNAAVFISKWSDLNVALYENAKTNDDFCIYPNPNSGTFMLNSWHRNKGEIKIINMLGQEVFNKTISNNCILLETDIKEQGAYIYLITEDSKLIASGKLIISQ